jgi:hypothetical protein
MFISNSRFLIAKLSSPALSCRGCLVICLRSTQCQRLATVKVTILICWKTNFNPPIQTLNNGEKGEESTRRCNKMTKGGGSKEKTNVSVKCWWRNMVFFWVGILLPPNVTWHKCGIPKRDMVQCLHPLDLVVCILVKMAQRNLEECFCPNI